MKIHGEQVQENEMTKYFLMMVDRSSLVRTGIHLSLSIFQSNGIVSKRIVEVSFQLENIWLTAITSSIEWETNLLICFVLKTDSALELFHCERRREKEMELIEL